LIDFRYHIVSIVAVFLALALGLFLGSTTLQSTVTNQLSSQAHSVINRNHTLEADNSQLTSALKGEQKLSAALEPYAVADRLTGTTVALVSAPGVQGNVRKAVSATLQLAGATVTADVQVQATYLDPTQDAELSMLATELELPGHPLPAGNGVTQVSSELANVLLVRPGRHPVSRARVDQALSALSDGGFINVSGSTPDRPADLAVMLVAAPSTSGVTPAIQTQQNTELLALATDLRAASAGAVLGGPLPVTGVPGSMLAAARADSTLVLNVSTVDFDPADPAAGRIAIVLALSNAPTETVGAYGLGSNPPLPSPSPSP
jgi:Copper transport outer membrane protein, MctB